MMKLTSQEMDFFCGYVQPLLQGEPVMRMDTFIQHGHTSCLHHSLAVAYFSYTICRRLRLRCDEMALIRGAMLHDFFLYDWHEPDKSHRWHGFFHPRTALANAELYFMLSDTEREVILKHMWPLTLRPPRCREALMVCLVDKACSLMEVFSPLFGNRSYRICQTLLLIRRGNPENP